MSQVFVKSDQLKEIVYDARLRIDEWKVLFAVNGELDLQGIASFLELPETDVSKTLSKLQEMQFISSEDRNGGLGEGDVVAEVSTFETETESSDIEFADETAEAPEAGATAETATDALEDTPVELDDDIFSLELEDTPETAAEESTEENIFALEDQESDFDLDNVLGDTEEAETAEAVSDSADDDLDKLIGNLLDDEPAPEAEEAPAVDTDSAAADSEQQDTDFDLGSIFQEEVGETVAEAEAEIDESIDDVLGSFGDETVIEEAPPAPAAPAPAGDSPGTILVVDDSVVIRKMVEIALENESYNIVSVATGKEALNYLDDNTPDLIILDIMLSDVNGLDILKAIKASKDIPVVMLSAKDTPRETSKAKQLGADDFIPKPFKDEELVGKIKELINK